MKDKQDKLLRQVLTINGWVSGATGLFIAVFAATVDRWLNTDTVGGVRVVGIALVLFSVSVLATARAEGSRLRSGGQAILIADVVWVLASLIAVAAGWFSLVGNLLVLVIAGAVGLFAAGEAIGLRRMSRIQTA